MKRNFWFVYLFDGEEKKEIIKIMKFNTINEMSYVLQMPSSVLSNFFHGLINHEIF